MWAVAGEVGDALLYRLVIWSLSVVDLNGAAAALVSILPRRASFLATAIGYCRPRSFPLVIYVTAVALSCCSSTSPTFLPSSSTLTLSTPLGHAGRSCLFLATALKVHAFHYVSNMFVVRLDLTSSSQAVQLVTARINLARTIALYKRVHNDGDQVERSVRLVSLSNPT